jgi:hypothetical protein
MLLLCLVEAALLLLLLPAAEAHLTRALHHRLHLRTQKKNSQLGTAQLQ